MTNSIVSMFALARELVIFWSMPIFSISAIKTFLLGRTFLVTFVAFSMMFSFLIPRPISLLLDIYYTALSRKVKGFLQLKIIKIILDPRRVL